MPVTISRDASSLPTSTPGKGSTFRAVVALPRAEGADDAIFMPPDFAGLAVLLVAPMTIEASLIERRLTRWGASVTLAEATLAAGMLAERTWDAVLVDHSIGAEAAAVLADSADDSIARRIVLIAPSERHRLAALKQAGFTGYLVKPVRAASLKAQLAAASDIFDATSAAAETNAHPAPADAAHEAHRSGARRSLAILIAEDNEINALLTRTLLTRLGHRPTVAVSGTAALECWRAARANSAPYDLVLMDMHMPGSDGIEAARRIRALEAERNEPATPIVALTANAFAEDRGACLAAGMDGFLVKPLDRERLAATLADLSRRAPIAA